MDPIATKLGPSLPATDVADEPEERGPAAAAADDPAHRRLHTRPGVPRRPGGEQRQGQDAEHAVPAQRKSSPMLRSSSPRAFAISCSRRGARDEARQKAQNSTLYMIISDLIIRPLLL